MINRLLNTLKPRCTGLSTCTIAKMQVPNMIPIVPKMPEIGQNSVETQLTPIPFIFYSKPLDLEEFDLPILKLSTFKRKKLKIKKDRARTIRKRIKRKSLRKRAKHKLD